MQIPRSWNRAAAPFAMIGIALLAAAPPAHGQSDDWKFRLSFPLWLVGIDGEVTARDRTLTTGEENDDVGGLLDKHFNFGFAAHFEAEKGRLGVFADIMYLQFEGDRETRFGTSIEAEADAYIGELGLFYTLIAPAAADKHPFRVDLLGGGRATGMGVEVDTDTLGSGDREKDWVDPFIGARAELGVLKWLSLKARGDIGGFGIGDGETSELVWNVEAGVEFKVAKWLDVGVGYRWLDYDYEDGSGDDLFKVDATLAGPYVAIEFNF